MNRAVGKYHSIRKFWLNKLKDYFAGNFFVVVMFLLLSSSNVLDAQKITKDNYTGSFTDNNSWQNPPAPNIPVTTNVIIYGNIQHIGDITFNANLTVNDTFRIFGDLTMGSNDELIINSGGILIIYGNYYPGNKTNSAAGGTLVITGDLVKQGAPDQGDFEITGTVYIFGDVVNAGDGYGDLTCTPPDTFPDCGYGDYEDLLNDSTISDFFESGSYSISASGPTEFCEGGSVTLSVPNDGSWYQWFRNNSIISGANSFSFVATQSGAYHLRMKIGADTLTLSPVTVTVKTNSTAPESASSDRNDICSGDGSIVLSYAGGTPGTGAIARWYSDAGFTANAGAGNDLSIPAPPDTTEYFVRFEGDCDTTNAVSVVVRVKPAYTATPSDFFITLTNDTFACQEAIEEVVWEEASLVNVSATGQNLVKTAGGNNWNAGAASLNKVYNNGYLRFTASETNTRRMIGLSTTNADAGYTSIRYAWYLRDNELRIFENGNGIVTLGTYSTGDVFEIKVENGQVRYYHNGTFIYRSTLIPVLPMLVDVSIFTSGGTVTDVFVSNPGRGRFEASAGNLGTDYSWQWQLNGMNVGDNSTVYTNTSLVPGDKISCILKPDECSVDLYTSNTIEISTLPTPASINVLVTTDGPIAGCRQTVEQVVWDPASLLRVDASGNNLSKFVSNSNWNGGASSLNKVFDNGYVQFIASETITARMLGLSSSDTDAGYITIQYAIYLRADGTINIYESGSNRGTFSTYISGDTLKISAESGKIKYYKNDSLMAVSGVTPVLPLIVDASLRDVPATLNNVTISNVTTGSFTAATFNAGTNPAYQWTLNGSAVGDNSPNYTNAGLTETDTLRVTIIPDLPGCNLSSLTSLPVTVRPLTSPLNIDFFIKGNPEIAACQRAIEDVVWEKASLSNLDVNGNNLLKVFPNASWDGGAVSLNTVSDYGYMEFTTSENNKFKAAGLSTSNTDSHWNTINYLFFLRDNGNFEIREGGSTTNLLGTARPYNPGDLFRIAVINATIKYYHNDVLIFISSVSPTLPLFFDVSLRDIGATINNAVVSNYNTGDFSAFVTNAGANPAFQWKLNGINVGGNEPTYVNTSLLPSDEITCVLIPDLGGCGTTEYTSNKITVVEDSNPASIDFFIAGDGVPTGCQTATEQVVWDIASLANVDITGGNLLKIQGGNAWNAGAASLNKVYNNGYLQFIASETNTLRAVGLSTTDTNPNENTIQYNFRLNNTGTLSIYESGSNRGGFGAYNTGDTLKIAVESGVVKYYRNNVLLYISAITPTLPLLTDISINTNGGTVQNVTVANFTNGTFTATATNAGANPSFQWKLNGVNVGDNDPVYINTTLADSDTLICILTPDLGGCSSTIYPSNTITINDAPAPGNIDFFIQGTSATSACLFYETDVVWNTASFANVGFIGNDLVKIQGGNVWNGGASSHNQVFDGGYFEMVITELSLAKRIGLSTTDTDVNWNTIQYAFAIRTDNLLEIYESGTGSRITGIPYSIGDTIRIAAENAVIKYYRNNTLLYISTISPVFPLLVDASFYSLGGTVSGARIRNLSTGSFVATATNAGLNPVYQWKLNGMNVGMGTDTYTNNTLTENDIVECELSPDLAGCGTSSYISNQLLMQSNLNPASIDFYITGDGVPNGCQTATEEVVWDLSSIVGVDITGNNLRKIQGGGAWNAGAASLNKVHNNGYLEFTALETDRTRRIGLSNVNLNAAENTIQYAFTLRNDGRIEINESGSGNRLGSLLPYATGDTFRIAVEQNVVNYYQNENILYISAISPTLPLLVDVSIWNTNGTVNNAVVTNFTNGTFTATATNAGANPSYQWKLNGINVGDNSNTYINTSLADSDGLSCILTPDLGGCGSSVYNSNSITINNAPLPASIDFHITGTPALTACQLAVEEVVWETASLSNILVSGNNLIKLQSNGAWDGGAASLNTVSDNGYLEFTASETNRARMVGLSTNNTDNNWNTIAYAIYLRDNGVVEVRESGSVNLIGALTYNTGDVFRIEVENGVVKYYQNGTLFRISSAAPTLPLLVDVSLRDIGATVTNAVVSNYNTGTFTASVSNAGANPVYQWKLNGINVGSNDPTYVNTSLLPADVITCVLTPDLGGCGTAEYLSNKITVVEESSPASIDFFITGDGVPNGCQIAAEQVVWNLTSLVNIDASANNLVKIQGGGAWNAGAASHNKVYENGYMQFIASETNTFRTVGLSTLNTDEGENSIQYRFRLSNTGGLNIYESTNNRGAFGTYSTGDTLKIAVEYGVIKYYRNNTLLYVSNVAPTLPLLVDVSIYSTGGTVQNVTVSNYTLGTFTVTATNAGTNPVYQWKLNGLDVGTDNPVYTNTALSVSDELTCVLTPDFGGCSSAEYTSNKIKIYEDLSAATIDFHISGTPEETSCYSAVENVVWSVTSVKKVLVSDNNLTKVSSTAWDGGAFSLNSIGNNAYLEFTATETNTLRALGLSNTDTDLNFTSIPYCFYLMNTGALRIYESGTQRGGALGNYSDGDVLRIAVENNIVKYYRNGTLLYTSLVAPTYPLYADASLNTTGATLQNVKMAKFNTGTFTATATNAGANPLYQWKLNGNNVGDNSNTYTNLSLNNSDVISCVLTPDVPGCGASEYNSNTVVYTLLPDLVPPTITCPDNLTAYALPASCFTDVTVPDPIYSDNCGILSLSWTMTGATSASSPPDGINIIESEDFNVGLTNITYTVTDIGGNPVNCSFTVTVQDTIEPVSLCRNLIIDLAGESDTTIPAQILDDGSSDNCAIAGFSASQTFFDLSNLGENTVTLIVTDIYGNSSTCESLVTIVQSQNVAPDTAFVDRNNICSGDGDIVLGYSGGYMVPGAEARWYSDDIFTILVGTGNDLSIPAPADTQTYYVRFEGIANTTDAVSVTVIINPLPTPSITGPSEACEGETEVFSTPHHANHTYSWSVTGGTIVAGDGTHEISVEFTASGSAEIQVTENNDVTGCSAISAIHTVTVHPTQVIDKIDSNNKLNGR